MNTFAICAASLLGLSSLILDAIGAHALKHWLPVSADLNQILTSWQSATRTQMAHALFLVGIVALSEKLHPLFCRTSITLTVLGVLLFSGSIYLKILCGMESITRVAPYGGFMLMLAWVSLAIAYLLK